MFGGSSGGRVLRRIAGIGVISHLVKSNAEILGGYKAEEVKVSYHGESEGTV